MIHLLCIICPPLAVLCCGKPISAILNIILTCCFWIPGVIHAFAVVGSANADRRNRELMSAMQGYPHPSKSSVGLGGLLFIGAIVFAVLMYQKYQDLPIASKVETNPEQAPQVADRKAQEREQIEGLKQQHKIEKEEVAKEKATEKAEETAAELLKSARYWLKDNQKEIAIDRVDELLKRFPDSKFADEAKAFKAQLEKK